MYISACTLHGISQFTKTGSGVDQNVGPVNATNKVTYSNTSTGHFIIEGDFGDSYTDLVLENTSTGQLDFARRGASNTVSGQINIIISAGTVSLANLSTAQVSVSGNIGINSTGGTIIFGGLTHQIGGALSYTNLAGGLNLSRYTKLGSSPIDLLATGSANRLTLGASSSFNGKFKASFPSILIQGGVFADSLTLTKTGNSSDQGSGDLTCNGPATFTSTHSSGIWQINYAGSTCVYNDNVIYQRNGNGGLEFGYGGPHHFKKDLHITGTHALGTTNNYFTFNGSGNQTITRGHSLSSFFLRLAVDKPSGELIVDLPLNVSVNLNLQKGNIKTTSANSFGLSLNATLTGGSDSSYVEGPMTKAGTTAFTFPLGRNGHYKPLSITAPSSNSTYKALYANLDPSDEHDFSSKDGTINEISTNEYWTFERTAGTAHVMVSLYRDNMGCSYDSLNNLKITAHNGSTWKDLGQGSTTGNDTLGFIGTNGSSSIYGMYTLATTDTFDCVPCRADAGEDKIFDLNSGWPILGTLISNSQVFSYVWNPFAFISENSFSYCEVKNINKTEVFILMTTNTIGCKAWDSAIVYYKFIPREYVPINYNCLSGN